MVVAGLAGAVLVVVLLVAVVSALTGGPAPDDPVQQATSRTLDRGPGSVPSSTTAGPTTSAAPSTTTPTGRFQLAPGGTALVGTGPTHRYRVEVEDGSGVDATDFAKRVDEILGDPRGWTTADGISLQRVTDDDADFTVRLSTPTTTDRLCAPLETNGRVSCGHEDAAIINLTRWREGDDRSGLDVAGYRSYLISHEVGHLLGHAHEECAGPGQRATTMMQQTYSIGECTPNPWPAPDA